MVFIVQVERKDCEGLVTGRILRCTKINAIDDFDGVFAVCCACKLRHRSGTTGGNVPLVPGVRTKARARSGNVFRLEIAWNFCLVFVQKPVSCQRKHIPDGWTSERCKDPIQLVSFLLHCFSRMGFRPCT